AHAAPHLGRLKLIITAGSSIRAPGLGLSVRRGPVHRVLPRDCREPPACGSRHRPSQPKSCYAKYIIPTKPALWQIWPKTGICASYTDIHNAHRVSRPEHTSWDRG